MNRRRRGRAPLWPRVAAIAVAVVVLALLIFLVVRLFSGALRLGRDGGVGEPDPQFAEPAEQITRPPELTGGGESPFTDDPSAHWVQTEQTPVDKTAEELGREAAAAD